MNLKTKFNSDLLAGLKRKKTKKVVLLFSAGVESTASGILLTHKGYQVYPLYIDYKQTAAKVEKILVNRSSKKLGFEKPFIIATDILSKLSKSKLLGSIALDDADAWVPGRNTLFMILAGIYAKQIDADGICVGYMLEDNFVFGDNDYFHHLDVESLLSKSFLQPIKVFMPIKHLTKKELISLIKKNQALDLIVSCWNPKISKGKLINCMRCANCQERDNSD